MKGLALKATYNDGGAHPGGLVGYRDVCSDRVMLDNVRVRKMTNCSAEGGPCRVFVDRNFKGKRPRLGSVPSWCYESTLLSTSPWCFSSGMYHHGPRAGEPMPITNVEPGDIAFLTTLTPGSPQPARFVFALFRIARVNAPHWGGRGILSDGNLEILLPDEMAPSVRFWDYFTNKGGREFWGTGLHRHLNEASTRDLLANLLSLLGDREERDILYAGLCGQVAPRPLPTRRSANQAGRSHGGEGEAHRRLKQYVAENPAAIGLPNSAMPFLEYAFPSGDRVDIMFDLGGGRRSS